MILNYMLKAYPFSVFRIILISQISLNKHFNYQKLFKTPLLPESYGSKNGRYQEKDKIQIH